MVDRAPLLLLVLLLVLSPTARISSYLNSAWQWHAVAASLPQ